MSFACDKTTARILWNKLPREQRRDVLIDSISDPDLSRDLDRLVRQGWTELRKSILREDPAVLGTLDNVCRALVREFT